MKTKKESYWASFLPSDIAAEQTFMIQQLSLILFAVIDNRIFAIVGGTGIRVILRYINHRFGLELYEYLAVPSEDVINFITTRGISGKLSEQRETFRDGQNLADSLSFTSIPNKINLLLREDLKNTVFDFIDFNSEKVFIEISSYFCIKIRVTFHEIHCTFKKIVEILSIQPAHSLSSFVLIKDKALTDSEYRMELYYRLRQDMEDNLTPSRTLHPPKFDIDFVHPSKLQDFYECDRYELVARGDKLPFFTSNDRSKLYIAGLKYLYTNSTFINFNYLLSGIRVYGYKGNTRKTHAMFTHHLTCEIRVNAQPIFLIDTNWYKVKNDFVETINRICQDMITKSYLRDNILTVPWPSGISEGDYNLSYANIQNFRVFDKAISQNIELCDLYFEDENNIYLIHVKTGFDAKIRELSNQIVISATRFWNDKSSGTYEFLNGVINSYNANPLNENNLIDRDNFINNLNTKDIYFVMAFKSGLANHLDIRTNIHRAKSNIAKYSLIQCVRDMNTNSYPIKMFNIPSS